MSQPLVVYHVAAMGNWQEVVHDQLSLLAESGFSEILLTHVGLGLDWILAEAKQIGISPQVVRSDPNTDHYETFALIEIDRLAKSGELQVPILYLHTKGVSAPGHEGKRKWRLLMEEYVVRRWRQNMIWLQDHDVIGVNWWQHGDPHFSGNFWMATPQWLQKLPNYVAFHHSRNLVRYSCEMWIGSTPGCRAKSLVCSNHTFWYDNYDFDGWLKQASLEWFDIGSTDPLPKEIAAFCEQFFMSATPRAKLLSGSALAKLWQLSFQLDSPKLMDFGTGSASIVFRCLLNNPEVWTVDEHPERLAKAFLWLSSQRLSTDHMFTLATLRQNPPTKLDLVVAELPETNQVVPVILWLISCLKSTGTLIVVNYQHATVRNAIIEVLKGWTIDALPEVTDVYGRHIAWCVPPAMVGSR